MILVLNIGVENVLKVLFDGGEGQTVGPIGHQIFTGIIQGNENDVLHRNQIIIIQFINLGALYFKTNGGIVLGVSLDIYLLYTAFRVSQ